MGGGYTENIHCHLNLSPGDSGTFSPLSEEFRKSKFSESKKFTRVPKIFEYPEYSRVSYKELEKQYLEFKKKTFGKANYNHIDCHEYCNLRIPVMIPYQKLIKKYNITTARYYGEHVKLTKSFAKRIKIFLFDRFIAGNSSKVKSCRAEYYLEKLSSFSREDVIEIYVHPDYINGILMDNTASVFGHERVSLIKHIEEIKSTGNIEFISWTDFNKNI